jgi:gamma-glutamyl phosphate reductase
LIRPWSSEQNAKADIRQLEQRLTDQQNQLQKVRQGLAQRDTELATCRNDLESARRAAKADVQACSAAREKLPDQVKASSEASGQQIQRMKDLEDNLRQRLQDEIGAKNVEIERLRCQLSVRVLGRILFRSAAPRFFPKAARSWTRWPPPLPEAMKRSA